MPRALTEKAKKRKRELKEVKRLENVEKRKLAKKKYAELAKLLLFDMDRPPKVIVMVPVRNRDDQKLMVRKFYSGSSQLKLVFINQNWDSPFNRGAMLNICFLEIKKLFPETYRGITLVTHDVDVLPYPKYNIKELTKLFITKSNVVKHNYGFTYTLGGVVSILAEDYEKVGGFPNIYGWNREDAVFQERVTKFGLLIDRSKKHFIIAESKDALLLSHNVPFSSEYRVYLDSEFKRSYNDIDKDTFDSIKYEHEIDGNDIMVTSFSNANIVELDLSNENIKVWSKNELPPSLLIGKEGNNILDTESSNRNGKFYISNYSKKKYGILCKKKDK